jgi:hypothetical protein
MKKLFFLVLTVLIVACSSDDDNTSEVVTCDESKIVGAWVNQVMYDNGSAPLDSWEFISDGTGSWLLSGLPNGEGLTNITWEAIGGSVISINVVYAGEETSLVDFNYTFSSNCDVMNLQADANEYFPDAVNFSYDRFQN